MSRPEGEAMPTGTMAGTPQVLLAHHLKQLKLPTMLREYEKIARECARDGLDQATIPAIIVEDEGGDEIALIENIQRENLSPVDEFEAVARLIEKHGYTQGEAAKALGKSRVSVNELMTLGTLAAVILDEARTTRATHCYSDA